MSLITIFTILGLIAVLLGLIVVVVRFASRPVIITESVANTNPQTFVQILFKILVLALLGFIYFFIAVMSLMSIGSCGIETNECKYITDGFVIGAAWLCLSYVVTALTILSDKFSKVPFLVTLAFKPYIALPMYVAIVTLGMML